MDVAEAEEKAMEDGKSAKDDQRDRDGGLGGKPNSSELNLEPTPASVRAAPPDFPLLFRLS